VTKLQAGRELLIAVELVMRGQRFVSEGLNGHRNSKPTTTVDNDLI
jgi:hypothetical protein